MIALTCTVFDYITLYLDLSLRTLECSREAGYQRNCLRMSVSELRALFFELASTNLAYFYLTNGSA